MAGRGKSVTVVDHREFDYHVLKMTMVEPSIESVIAMGKAALHFAALFVPFRQLRGSGIDVLRNALLTRQTDVQALSGVTAWDYEFPDISDTAFYHALQMTACPETHCLYVRVHVYGMIRMRFVLSDTYSGRRHSVRTCIEQPKTGEREEFRRRCAHPIPWWLRGARVRML